MIIVEYIFFTIKLGGVIMSWVRFLAFVAKKGKSAVQAAWKYKDKVLKWLNIGPTLDWVWQKLKNIAGL